MVKVRRSAKKEVDIDGKGWVSTLIDLQKGRKGKEVSCCSRGSLLA